ncbi:uncharacterized protein [Anabrus simplex]|uniref:uncharacterized protein n=1 Tax=Anabrus simplex TaxID=316456 RepID=UPI0035A2726F
MEANKHLMRGINADQWIEDADKCMEALAEEHESSVCEKSFHVYLCLVITMLKVEPQSNMNDNIMSCHQQFPVSNETLSYSLTHNLAVPDETNEVNRCFVQCLLQKFGAIKDGNFNTDGTIQAIETAAQQVGRRVNTARVNAAIRSCLSKDGAGNCMKIYLISKCIHTEIGRNFQTYLM